MGTSLGWFAERAVWSLAWVVLFAACSPSDEESGPGPDEPEAYCAPLFTHLAELCQPLFGRTGAAYFGASRRKTCQAMPWPPEHDCLLGLTACTEQSLIACDAPDRSYACPVSGECPNGLVCDTEQSECLECLSEADCSGNASCQLGLCIPPEYLP
jgi:hypothetical protein